VPAVGMGFLPGVVVCWCGWRYVLAAARVLVPLLGLVCARVFGAVPALAGTAF
jgi:hypothetical protein